MIPILPIYDRLPQTLQTILLNLYGIRNCYRMKLWLRLLSVYQRTELWSVDEQISYVADRLRETLIHAISTVPRYHSLHRMLPELIQKTSNVFSLLGQFPVVTREEVIREPLAFLSRSSRRLVLVSTITSGTTGTPFRTWMDRGTLTATDALWWRRTLWNGHRPRDWIARLVGDPIIPLSVPHPKRPWHISFPDRRLYLSTFHLNPATAKHYFDILEDKKPAFLMGYPSSLEILASLAIELNRTLLWSPKKVLFSSEPMYPHQEEIITKVFRAPIRGLYGSAERIVSASQCENATYHLALVDGYVEGQFGLTPESQPALVTTLLNKVMPLIRFELGDMIQFSPHQSCDCGRTLPMIEPVVTKNEDWLETPTGRRISPSALTWAFKDLGGIRRSQIVQTRLNSVEVHLDVTEDVYREVRSPLEERLHALLFGEMHILCLRNNDIHISKAGKTRFVVKEMEKNETAHSEA
jgi:phenylacetate-CoA ligase